MHKFFASVLSLGVLIALVLSSGCAKGPRLEKFPETYIDRPYTLPKGVTSWVTTVTGGVLKDNQTSFVLYPIPNPFIWQQSLTDDWTLTWGPLPLLLQHQIFKTDSDLVGAHVGIGSIGYTSTTGLFVTPTVGGYYRRRLQEKWALENSLNFNPTFMSSNRNGQQYLWNASYRVGPLAQVSPKVAVSPHIAVAVERGYQTRYYSSDAEVNQTLNTTFPVGFWAGWALHRQWNLAIDYTYTHLGYASYFEAHLATLTLHHYW